MDYRLLQFDVFEDERGKLIALEGNRAIPFEIKRVFYMYDTGAGIERGRHANMISKQVMVCLSGTCSVVIDDGKIKRVVALDSPNEGLYIGPKLWREVKDFSKGCVLMVFTDTYYTEHEYVTDYAKFRIEEKTQEDNV